MFPASKLRKLTHTRKWVPTISTPFWFPCTCEWGTPKEGRERDGNKAPSFRPIRTEQQKRRNPQYWHSSKLWRVTVCGTSVVQCRGDTFISVLLFLNDRVIPTVFYWPLSSLHPGVASSLASPLLVPSTSCKSLQALTSSLLGPHRVHWSLHTFQSSLLPPPSVITEAEKKSVTLPMYTLAHSTSFKLSNCCVLISVTNQSKNILILWPAHWLSNQATKHSVAYGTLLKFDISITKVH